MAKQGFEPRPPGLQTVGKPWILALEPVIRIQMRPQPLSDLGGVIIVSNMQMATQGHAAEKPVLTPRWNCFFDLFFVIIITQNGLPQNLAPLPDC